MKAGRGTVSGKPIEEAVVWYGPIVMNMQEQLRHAFGRERIRSMPACSDAAR
jgi:Pirin C-terminal cupin domain